MENKKDLENLRGKFIKQTLTNLEVINKLDPETRKIVLDSFNEFVRELYKLLGVSDV